MSDATDTGITMAEGYRRKGLDLLVKAEKLVDEAKVSAAEVVAKLARQYFYEAADSEFREGAKK